jgi:uncharacterized LabA/DUF88 family protein
MGNSTYVFIDAQNLHLGIKDCGWEIDYLKLNIYLKEKYKVSKAFMYLGYIKRYQKLYRYLQNSGFELLFKQVVQKSNTKGNVDVLLSVDTLRKIDNYSKAVFISADGDFLPLYDYLTKEKRKEILVLIPNRKKYSRLLLEYKSSLRFMNDLKSKIGK